MPGPGTANTNTVALLGPTGLLGSGLLAVLGPLHAQGKLRLVVLHRAGSNTALVPAGVETRVLDVESATADEVVAALEGVDILVNATNKIPFEADKRFVAALGAALPRTQLRTYVPSDFALNFSTGERDHAANVLLQQKVALSDAASAAGIPLTVVHNGVFEPFVFAPPFLGIDAKANTMSLYADALAKPLPVTSVSFLAHALAQLLQRPPDKIAESSYTVVEGEYTGSQLANALEAAHGRPPQISEMTDAELDAMEKDGGAAGALSAAVRRKWGAGSFHADDRFDPAGVPRRSVEQIVADAVLKA